MNDFLPKQPTQNEKLIQAIYNELRGVTINLAKQIRTLCLLLKVKPEKFVESFNDEIGLEVFLKNLMQEEAKFAEEKKKKEEELKKLNG